MTYEEHLTESNSLSRKRAQEAAEVDRYLASARGKFIVIKTLSSGQPRAYADSIYEAEIFAFQEDKGGKQPLLLDRETAKALARRFVQNWTLDKTEGEIGHGLETQLRVLETIKGPLGEDYRNDDRGCLWHVKVVTPYCD